MRLCLPHLPKVEGGVHPATAFPGNPPRRVYWMASDSDRHVVGIDWYIDGKN